jgi:hypothetical protein
MMGHVITPIGVTRMNTGAISPAAMFIHVLEGVVPSPPASLDWNFAATRPTITKYAIQSQVILDLKTGILGLTSAA